MLVKQMSAGTVAKLLNAFAEPGQSIRGAIRKNGLLLTGGPRASLGKSQCQSNSFNYFESLYVSEAISPREQALELELDL